MSSMTISVGPGPLHTPHSSNTAIMYMGDMAYPLCAQSCRNLPGMWEMPTIEDLGLVWTDLYTASTNDYTWLKASAQDSGEVLHAFKSENVSLGNVDGHKVISASSPIWNWHCYCSIKEIPKVEYYTCKGSCSDNTELDVCVNEKLAEGWQIHDSQRQQQVSSTCFWQPLWRWAE